MKNPFRIIIAFIISAASFVSLLLIGMILMRSVPLPVSSANNYITISGTPVFVLDLWEAASHFDDADVISGPIDYSTPGRHRIELALQRGIRSAYSHAYLFVLELITDKYISINSPLPDPIEFIANYNILTEPIDIKIISDIPQTDEIGTKTIVLKVLDYEFTANIHIYDPYPPTAEGLSLVREIGEYAYAHEFVTNIFSHSQITFIGFLREPDFYTARTQTVYIVIASTPGNQAIIESELIILPNLIPPEITGVRDISIMRSGSLILRQGVQAFDFFGEDIDFTVDSSNVDVNTIGRYEITYIAIDRWGNETRVPAYVYIVPVDVNWVNNRIDEILASITNPDMTQVQKARAIFNWVGRNISYTATVRHPTDIENVYHALRFRTGNCFVFYSTAEMLLTRAGIPNRPIERVGVGVRSSHRWHLINPDNIGWHHFDTTPLNTSVAHLVDRFMFTSSQAVEFTDLIRRVVGSINYYTYDRELFDDIVW